MKTKHPNIVEFQVSGPYALFSDPIMRVGGEKCTYQIPTYEAMKGIMMSVYWKPTIIWYIDKVRVMKPIQTEVKGIRPIKYNNGGNDLAYYTYLKNCEYQVQAHFEWNNNRPELECDRNENKHHEIAKKMIKKGGRRDIFLGTRECQGYVEPCAFGEGEGAYDNITQLAFGLMWRPVMKNGVIEFLRPEECPIHKPEHEMPIKEFGKSVNFSGTDEFTGGDVR